METQATASLRLTLEDGTGRVASEGSFVVHTCPRAEHETDGPPPAQGCTDLAIPSTNGTVDVTLNQPGSARGYLGIELTTAPVNPGTYVVWVESLDQAYRVRETAQLVGRGPADEYRGGYAICTVMGGEILDQNFERTDPIPVELPTQAYLRLIDPEQGSNTVAAMMRSFQPDGTVVSPPTSVALSRIGRSPVFLAPILLVPADQEPDGAQEARAMSPPEQPTLRIEAEITVTAAAFGEKEVARNRGRKSPWLKFRWLDETGTSEVTRPLTTIIKVPDPATGQTLYVERTMARVVAVDSKDKVMTEAFYPVRVDEVPNSKFSPFSPLPTTRNWQFSYQGERGAASNLRFDRASPGYLTSIALYKGKTDPLELLSLAGPRYEGSLPAWDTSWEAQLSACLAVHATPCQLVPQDKDQIKLVNGLGAVRQWVDQQTYSRGGATVGQNSVCDWIEAAGWDVLSGIATGGDPTAVAVANDVQLLSQDARLMDGSDPDAYGRVPSTQNSLVTLFAANFDFDAFRLDTWMGVYYHGFLGSSERALTHVVLHEARHCWQYQTPWADQDNDGVPDTPEAFDIHALRLKDAGYAGLRQWYTGNFEVHFNSPPTTDYICTILMPNCLSATQRERDAEYFTMWATDGTANVLSNAVESLDVQQGADPLRIAAGQTLSGALVIAAKQWGGTADPCLNDTRKVAGTDTGRYEAPAPNIAVEFEMPNAASLSVIPPTPMDGACAGSENGSTLCVVMTGADGSATVGLNCSTGATPGEYVMTVRIRKLVPGGDAMGDVLAERPITVEVTQ